MPPRPRERQGSDTGRRLAQPTSLFQKYLAAQKLKLTNERVRILEEILTSTDHFGADDLHMRCVDKRIAVSRATIYRTLEHLVKSGLVRRVYLDQKRAFYEHVFGRRHHEHMICLSCSKVIEFSDDPLEQRQDKVCQDLGFKPLRHSLRIVGLCSRCQ